MSIVTKTGDDGTTALMYGRRVSKSHLRVQAYGAVDELNAALGMARATAERAFVKDNLVVIQKDLIVLMGELATSNEDLERYRRDGYSLVTHDLTAKLEKLVAELEAREISFKGWAVPGNNISSAALDAARTVCRRAEREICSLQQNGELGNREILVYLNRLSDLLWLFARWAESNLAGGTQ